MFANYHSMFCGKYSASLKPPARSSAASIVKGNLFCPNGSAVIDLVMYGKDGTKICIQVSEVAYPDHASASKTSDNPGKIHALIQ